MNTSNPVISCPAKEELDVFFANTITNPYRIAVLAEHISKCEKCQEDANAPGVPTNTTLLFAPTSQIETQENIPAQVPVLITGNPSNQTNPAALTEIFQSVNAPL